MEEVKTPAIEANVPAIAPEGGAKSELPTNEDYEAQIKALEDEKARLIEEGANYKVAYLKGKSKSAEVPEDESEDDRVRRIAREELANSRLTAIDREQVELAAKALKENKELKLALQNKADVPASVGSHSEGQPVKDTLVTSEQMAAFKQRGWSEKDIERYKQNLQRYGTR